MDDSVYRLTVCADPVAKGRPKFTSRGGFARAYTPARTLEFENMIADAWVAKGFPCIPQGVPLAIFTKSFLVRPRNHFRKSGELGKAGLNSRYPLKRPDYDNLGKCISDALNGVAFYDDSMVTDGYHCKRWIDDCSVVEGWTDIVVISLAEKDDWVF